MSWKFNPFTGSLEDTGGGLPSPGLAPWNNGSGSMLAPNSLAAPVIGVTATAGAADYHQIFIPETTTARALICRTSATYAGTSDVTLGIYTNAALRPVDKVVEASLQITASGSATYALAIDQPLEPDWYWLTFLASSVGTAPSFLGSTTSAFGVGGGLFSEVTATASAISTFRQPGLTSLPATAGSLQASPHARPLTFLGV